jgi:hypothetical protein
MAREGIMIISRGEEETLGAKRKSLNFVSNSLIS